MDDKSRILEMIKSGKITAKEAEKLLKALGEETEQPAAKTERVNHHSNKNNKKGKLRIIVDSADGEKVRIALPLRLSKMVAGMIPEGTLKSSNIDINAILDSLEDGIDDVSEDIVNVDDGEGNTVRIFVEK